MLARRSLHPALSTSLIHASIGNSTGIRFPSTASRNRFHAAAVGQSASEGLTRWRIVREGDNRAQRGSRRAMVDDIKNVRRFMILFRPFPFLFEARAQKVKADFHDRCRRTQPDLTLVLRPASVTTWPCTLWRCSCSHLDAFLNRSIRRADL